MSYIDQLKQFLTEEDIIDSNERLSIHDAEICEVLIRFARYLEKQS